MLNRLPLARLLPVAMTRASGSDCGATTAIELALAPRHAQEILRGVRHLQRALGHLLDGLPLAAELVEHGGVAEGSSQARGVRELPGEDQRLRDGRQGLVRIAQRPQGPRHVGLAA